MLTLQKNDESLLISLQKNDESLLISRVFLKKETFIFFEILLCEETEDASKHLKPFLHVIRISFFTEKTIQTNFPSRLSEINFLIQSSPEADFMRK